MKLIRIIGLGLGGLAVLLIVISFFLPNKTSTEVEITIDAPPAQVYPHVATLKSWPKWSAWGPDQIKDIQYKFEGPDQGVGAIMHWESVETVGTLTIEQAVPDQSMDYTITMEGGKGAAVGSFALTALDGGKTRLVWKDSSEIKSPPVLNRLMTPLMQSMMDEALAKGLQGIKEMSETNP